MPCRMMMNSRGTSVSSCSAISPRDRTPHRIAAKMIPIGLFCPRKATRDPGEPEADVVVRTGGTRGRPRSAASRPARQRARDQEQPDLDRADRDPAGLRRSGRGAHRPRLVARAASAGSGTTRSTAATIARESSHDRWALGVIAEEVAEVADQPRCRGTGRSAGRR